MEVITKPSGMRPTLLPISIKLKAFTFNKSGIAPTKQVSAAERRSSRTGGPFSNMDNDKHNCTASMSWAEDILSFKSDSPLILLDIS